MISFVIERLILVAVSLVCFYTALTLFVFTPLSFLFVVILVITVLILLPRNEYYPEVFLRRLIIMYFPLTFIWPYYIGVNIGFMDLHPSRILLFIILFYWLFYFVTSPNFRSLFFKYKNVSSSFLIVIGIYLFTHVSGIPFSPNITASINGAFKMLIEVYIPASLFLMVVNKREIVETVISVFIGLGIVVSIVGVWENFSQTPFWPAFFPFLVLNEAISDSGVWRYEIYRVTSIFAHPLSMVQFQVVVLSFMAYRYYSTTSIVSKLIMLIAMLGTVFVMFASDSRSIMPALFLMVGIFLAAIAFKIIKSKKTGFLGWLFTSSFPLIAIASILIFYVSRQVFMGASDIATLSTNARYEMWYLAWQRMLDNPLGGVVGFGLSSATSVVNWRGGVSVDSFFINVMIDQGVFGFVLYLLIYFYTVFIAIKLWIHSKFSDFLPIFIVIALSAYMVIAFISSLWHSLHLYYMTVAIMWILYFIDQKQVNHEVS